MILALLRRMHGFDDIKPLAAKDLPVDHEPHLVSAPYQSYRNALQDLAFFPCTPDSLPSPYYCAANSAHHVYNFSRAFIYRGIHDARNNGRLES